MKIKLINRFYDSNFHSWSLRTPINNAPPLQIYYQVSVHSSTRDSFDQMTRRKTSTIQWRSFISQVKCCNQCHVVNNDSLDGWWHPHPSHWWVERHCHWIGMWYDATFYLHWVIAPAPYSSVLASFAGSCCLLVMLVMSLWNLYIPPILLLLLSEKKNRELAITLWL